MILFNLHTLSKLTKDNCTKVIRYFSHVARGTRMDKMSLKIHNSEDKFSFIVNERDLIKNDINATKEEISVYIYLAGSRSYMDYVTDNILYLPIASCSFDVPKLKNNRLINITDENIILFYEQ